MWLDACGQGRDGLLLWANTFGMIAEPRDKIIKGAMSGMHVLPWLTWSIQDMAMLELYDAVTLEHDLLIEKSRDMGATWNSLAVFMWYWLFKEHSMFLVTSRTEDFVDKTGSPKALFWKLDFMLEHLPSWMVPSLTRTHMHLSNDDNGSVIDGESTNKDIARGDRRKAILFDEFATCPEAAKVLAASADATGCRLFNSTPRGAGHTDGFGNRRGNAFAALRESKQMKVLRLHWSDHPVKGAGRERIADPDTGGKKWTSPWYRAECVRRGSKVEIAQELDIDYLASGDIFFDRDVLTRARASELCTDPRRAELAFTVETIIPGISYKIHLGELTYTPKGILSIWDEPGEDNYAAFADISMGTGASNSCLHVGAVGKRIQVASLLTPFLSPDRFAQYAAAVCLYYCGQTEGAFLGWEANLIGEVFGREICRLGYLKVLGNINQSLPWEPSDKKIGWYSNRQKKLDLLSDFRGCLAKREYTVRDAALISELEMYINFEDGGVGPSELVGDSSGARLAHGDRVIAGAGMKMCMERQPLYVHTKKAPGMWSMEYFDDLAAAAATEEQQEQLWVLQG